MAHFIHYFIEGIKFKNQIIADYGSLENLNLCLKEKP
jgi:hypothetical protein